MAGRIVVGVDGSPGSAVALRWALEEARRRGATLHVVHAWSFPFAGEAAVVAMASIDFEQEARQLLDEVVREHVGADPGVEVVRSVPEGPAAHALTRIADGADLLVVGSRGRGGFAGLLLGSVSQQCVHHAPCPGVVVPSSTTERD